MKRKIQRPLIINAEQAPPRKFSSVEVNRNYHAQVSSGEHRGVKLGPRVQESAAERSQRKGKEIWRPRPQEEIISEKKKYVPSGAHSQRSAIDKIRQEWQPKKIETVNPSEGRHPGESSRRSHHSSASPPREIVDFDRSPRIEEVSNEPEIHWRRRSKPPVQGKEDKEDDMEVEVVYMVEHNDQPGTRFDNRRRRSRPHIIIPSERQEGEISSSSSDGERLDEQEEEEEPVFIDSAALAREQKDMMRQLKAKDKEIAQLDTKMNEMMAQMNAMMQMMQGNIAAGPVSAPPNIHQTSASAQFHIPTNPPVQTSGVQIQHERSHTIPQLTPQNTPQQNPQNVASLSEQLTSAQLETLISEKIQAAIALEQ